METRLKGAGKLSRKLLTILVLAAMPGLGFAVDNSIYIDQTGSNANITITQDGAGNTVTGISSTGGQGTRGQDSATINASDANINVTQVGSGNKLSLGITATTVSGKSADVTYSTGNNGTTGSTALIDVNAKGQGTASNITINALQTGNSSNLKADIQGSGSTLSVTTAGYQDSVNSKMRGDGNTANITFSSTGGGNQATLDQSGTGSNSIGINVNGTGNIFDVKQAGYSNGITIGGYTSGSALVGNDNNIQLVQNSDNNSINLGITGSTNYIGVNQLAGTSGQEANIKINGSGNNVNISQGAQVPLLTLPTRSQ